jgi:hypothetical protein
VKNAQAVAGSLVLLLLFPALVKAQNETPPPMPLEDQEQLEQLQKLEDLAKNLQGSIETATAEKKNQCMKAFGDVTFCDCIGEKSPVGVNFIGYVSIAAGTKDDFHYDQLSLDDKKLFDATRAARDVCVNWKGKGDKLKPATN